MTPFHRAGSSTPSHRLAPVVLSATLAIIGATTFFAVAATGTAATSAATVTPHTSSVYNETRTAGADADATAADEFDAAYPNCPTDFNGSRSVILATDSTFPDALSASYLAGQMHTGILLTGTAELSGEAAASMRIEGVQTVYVVGGSEVVSPNVISELQNTAAYQCHATFPAGENLNVVVIAGPTEYDTSAAIAQYVPASTVGTAAFPGAYGAGQYDDTTGASSPTGPTTAVPTAIVATGSAFQDATAASVMADAQHFPVILTTPNTLATQAQSALQNLGIAQVIIVGGPLAVSDSVVSQIEALGISVLRIAGQDYTDTAQELAHFELNATPGDGLGWSAANQNQITLARGDYYTDALAGAAFAANIAGAPQPILLTFDPNTVGPYLTTFLQTVGAGAPSTPGSVDTVNILGGIQAITAATASTVLSDLSGG